MRNTGSDKMNVDRGRTISEDEKARQGALWFWSNCRWTGKLQRVIQRVPVCFSFSLRVPERCHLSQPGDMDQNNGIHTGTLSTQRWTLFRLYPFSHERFLSGITQCPTEQRQHPQNSRACPLCNTLLLCARFPATTSLFSPL